MDKAEFDCQRIDVRALTGSGVVAIEASRLTACRDWLKAKGYVHLTLDCSQDFDTVATDFGRLMNWEGRFGYAYESGGRGGDALQDGFQIRVPRKGLVFELYRADLLYEQAPRWVAELLSVISRHSRFHLLLERQFFGLVTVADQGAISNSAFLTFPFDTLCLGFPHRSHLLATSNTPAPTRQAGQNLIEAGPDFEERSMAPLSEEELNEWGL